MRLELMFLYPKVRSYFVWAHRDEEITNTQVDILLYIQYFQTADGFVYYSIMREYMKYNVKLFKSNFFKVILKDMMELDLIKIRDRRGNWNHKLAGLETGKDPGKVGLRIEITLTAKGRKYVNEFAELSSEYLEEHMVNKQLRAAGLKDRDDEFKSIKELDKLTDDWDEEENI